MQIKLISLTIVEHQDSLRNRDKQQLGNGPLVVSIRLDWKEHETEGQFPREPLFHAPSSPVHKNMKAILVFLQTLPSSILHWENKRRKLKKNKTLILDIRLPSVSSYDMRLENTDY